MKKSERISLIEEAIEKIQEAETLIDERAARADVPETEEALTGTNLTSHYEGYNKYGINQLLGNGNPYDSSLFTLQEELSILDVQKLTKEDQECAFCGDEKEEEESEICNSCR